MFSRDIRQERLARQRISLPADAPAEVVRHLGAVQAQDRTSATWAVALRTKTNTAHDVETALAEGALLRTHLFRGTWQLVHAEDIRWMLDLVGSHVLARAERRYRELGLDGKTLLRATRAIEKALEHEGPRTRKQLGDILTRAKVPTDEGRLSHVLAHAELTQSIVSGPIRGKQTTHALLDHRAPSTIAPNDPITELARRYFESRGPATIQDLAWWTGLPIQRLREAAIDYDAEGFAITTPLTAPKRSLRIHLLPAFDEYFVAYADRDALLPREHAQRINAGGGMIRPLLLRHGRIIGAWNKRLTRDTLHVTVDPLAPLSPADQRALPAAARHLARAAAHPVELAP